MKTMKIITAGALVKTAIYPRASGGEAPKVRAAKRKLSSAAQKRMNAKYQKEKLEMQLAANFGPRDLWVTFTFRDADLPETEAQVDACVKAFLRAYRKKRRGRARPVVIWRAEHKHLHDDRFQDARWHVHACITATGDDFDAIRSCWLWGDDVHIERLRIDKENSYAKIAAYMVKEPLDRAGAHAWHSTRNAKRPEVELLRVDDDTPLNVPRGCLLLESAEERNEFGSWRYLKYMLPFERRRRPPNAARRRGR